MSADLSGIRLLIVDDEEGYLNVLAKRMIRRGLRVTTAPSGSAGIQALRRADLDVAVVDLKMDDMDGIELLKVFKKMDPHLAVIILTGHGSEQAARDGLAFGAFDYLTKPCELQDLLAKIKDAYDCRKRGLEL
ncbi:MAG: response regulator [Proteobacteria bacterium]|nr:response regulator [Pseudomonadota bacterium]